MAKPFIQLVESIPEAKKQEELEVETNVVDDHDIALNPQVKKLVGKEADGLVVTAPKYTTLKRGPLQIGYAAIDSDYYYQIELLQPARVDDKAVIAQLIEVFSAVVPEHIQVYIQPPPPELDWQLWTVVVRGATELPGAKNFMERMLLDKLINLNFWT